MMKSCVRGRWDLVDEVARVPLKRVLPLDSHKGSVFYDVKKRPSEYVGATYRLSLERAACLQIGRGQPENKTEERKKI